jgi:hypothetical protein
VISLAGTDGDKRERERERRRPEEERYLKLREEIQIRGVSEKIEGALPEPAFFFFSACRVTQHERQTAELVESFSRNNDAQYGESVFPVSLSLSLSISLSISLAF